MRLHASLAIHSTSRFTEHTSPGVIRPLSSLCFLSSVNGTQEGEDTPTKESVQRFSRKATDAMITTEFGMDQWSADQISMDQTKQEQYGSRSAGCVSKGGKGVGEDMICSTRLTEKTV
jgi:hypothetical protein